jgi:site-specific DNA recombinase
MWHQTSVILEAQSKDYAKPAKLPVRLFGSLTRCHCGHKMYVPSGSRKYTCKKCRNSISEEDLDAIFYEELKAYFSAPERLASHLAEAQKTLFDRQNRITTHQGEIQRVREEMKRTHRLYLDGHIPLENFGSYHKPLEEQLRQLQDELPKLEAELTHLQIHELSADEVMREARELYQRWPTLPVPDKHKIIEAVAEGVTIGKDEITIHFSHLPSSEELTNSQQSLHGRCGPLYLLNNAAAAPRLSVRRSRTPMAPSRRGVSGVSRIYPGALRGLGSRGPVPRCVFRGRTVFPPWRGTWRWVSQVRMT